jgi:hypothetical protein
MKATGTRRATYTLWKFIKDLPTELKIVNIAKETTHRGLPAELFALYEEGMAVGEYFEIVLKKYGRSAAQTQTMANLKWDLAYGYIRVTDEV